MKSRDYEPISLIYSFAKLVSKLLANRLAPYLHKLVASNQSTFVRGCSIHDNYMFTSTQKLYSGGSKHIYTGVFQYRQC
jgi:hypothetical protein